jgi:hydrogenase expression/formation protein HypD
LALIPARPDRHPAPATISAAVQDLSAKLAALTTRPWTLMEVCGGQTHAIVRWGLDQLLPPGLRLIHGPGCPICVTPIAKLDAAHELARRPGLILCSYGDMLRVPGSGGASLLTLRSAGADVRLVTAPLQALEIARAHPERQVVFLAVGFETTAPATALLARRALALGLPNLSLLTAHVRVAPAMDSLLEPDSPAATPEATPALAPAVQGFLAAGHVCTVIGTEELHQLVARRRLPVVVTGFEPLDLLRGLLTCVRLLEAGTPRLVNAYRRVVREAGNPQARALLAEVFEPVDQSWRGLGLIRAGGLALRPPYNALEAERRFPLLPELLLSQAQLPLHQLAEAQLSQHQLAQAQRPEPQRAEMEPSPCTSCVGAPAAFANSLISPAVATPPAVVAPVDEPCIAAAILRGRALPTDCPHFGGRCTPEQPLGAPMVSSEGACAAYQRYRPRPAPAALTVSAELEAPAALAVPPSLAASRRAEP